MRLPGEPALETVVVLRDSGASAGDALLVAFPGGRPVEDLADQLEDRREQDLVRARFELPAPCPLRDVPRVESKIRIAVLEVLEDDRRVEQLHLAVHQDRHLALRVDGEDVRVLRLVALRPVERHRH